jgi:hypothetical protein
MSVQLFSHSKADLEKAVEIILKKQPILHYQLITLKNSLKI